MYTYTRIILVCKLQVHIHKISYLIYQKYFSNNPYYVQVM